MPNGDFFRRPIAFALYGSICVGFVVWCFSGLSLGLDMFEWSVKHSLHPLIFSGLCGLGAMAGYAFGTTLRPIQRSRERLVGVAYPSVTFAEAYKMVSDYDTHFSTVRMTVITFLLTFSTGLASFLFKEAVDTKEIWLAFLIPFAFLLLTLFLNAHFQRLTIACKHIQQALENGTFRENYTGEIIFPFRALLRAYYQKTGPWAWQDNANIALGFVVGLYLIVAPVVGYLKIHKPDEVCIVNKLTNIVYCGHLKRND